MASRTATSKTLRAAQLALWALFSCCASAAEEVSGAGELEWLGHGPIAPDISATLGEPLPSASASQRAAFERGRTLLAHRFTRAEGLGPAFNATFCGACHEKPVPGGAAGLY